jgi:type II secretory pathway component GspD/PulD (secretin)
VATAVNNFLRTELQAITLQTTGGGALLSPFEQIEHQVVVVAEPVSNSLIVAATPRYFEEIKKLVEDLDKRPPMVLIQVLIAEVDLTNNDEFGVEFGLQDKVLFNRGIPSTTGGTLSPGFLFNTDALGNQTVASPQIVGGQSLTNFGVGRTTTNGFGGLVLQASSESVSVLIRALQARQRVEILARPQIQTLDNQTAYINVGQSVAQIMGVTSTTYGQTNNIQYTNTGIIMGVTPRISPDGIVVMEIDANRSELGAEADGTPIFVSSTGQIIRAPRVNQQLAQTTISATDGQTVILGGLISRQQTDIHRQVPYLGDVPVLGKLFRFDTKETRKTELLIIMTPHVIRTTEDAEAVKRVEAARMHWCLADVVEMVGESGLRNRKDDWPDSETKVIYPDGDPRTQGGPPSPAPLRVPAPAPTPPEAIPAPEATPFLLEPSGAPKGATSPAPRGAPAGVGRAGAAVVPQASAARLGPGAINPPAWPQARGNLDPATSKDQAPGETFVTSGPSPSETRRVP